MSESIVLQVCREAGITPEEFFGPKRDRYLTNVRRSAIQRLLDAGFNMAGAARMIRRNYKTVIYWMRPEYRKKSNERARNYWVAKKAAGWIRPTKGERYAMRWQTAIERGQVTV